MSALLRFDGARVRDPAISAWFEARQDARGALARFWFGRLRACGPQVRELLHDGCPVALLEDAPFGYVNVFRAHLNVGFFHGAALPDPARLLRGTGKHMRHVRLAPGVPVDDGALQALIAAAWEDIRRRLQGTDHGAAAPPE